MVTDATKKFRDVFAYALLGVAALYFISAMSLLFKSEDDFGGAGFAERAATVGYLFTHPILVVSLAVAVALVAGFGEASKNAKVVVMVVLGLGAVSLLFGLIAWFSGFGADTSGDVFNGVLGAGKVVGIFLGLAQLMFLGVVVFFAFAVFQAFPKSAPSNQWSQGQGGYAPQGVGQMWGPQDQGYAPAGGQVWGPQDRGYAQPDQGYAPQGGQQQAWGRQDQGYAPQGGQQQAWGQQYSAGGSTAAGWGEREQFERAQSEQPQSEQEQSEQQGQPASSWERPASQGWGQESQEQPQPSWGDQPADASQQQWGATAAAPPAESGEAGYQPDLGQPGHDQPEYDQPGHDQPGHDEPVQGQPGYDEPVQGQPGYDEPVQGQPGYHQPGYDQPGYDQPGPGSVPWTPSQDEVQADPAAGPNDDRDKRDDQQQPPQGGWWQQPPQ